MTTAERNALRLQRSMTTKPLTSNFLVQSPLILCVFALMFFAGSAIVPASAVQADEITGLAFLKIGVGARACAMGSAHLAVVSDATSLYWNPAGLAQVDGLNLHLSHNEWFQDVRYEFMSVARRWGPHGFGVSFSGLYMDELERRDESGVFLGHFGFYDIAVSAGWGMAVKPGVYVGSSVKMLVEQIDDMTATGFAVDVGTKYDTPVPNLSVALGVFNVGPKMKFSVEEFSIPRSVGCGASYALPVQSLSGDVLMAADVVFYRGEDAKAHLGAEYCYKNLASLGLGYKFGYDIEGLSIGAGVLRGPFSFGYAYSVIGSELGDAHRVSLGYTIY